MVCGGVAAGFRASLCPRGSASAAAEGPYSGICSSGPAGGGAGDPSRPRPGRDLPRYPQLSASLYKTKRTPSWRLCWSTRACSMENAYALLTNIQGFDSFSLGPHSSREEISRAFQTQMLIWHPDKNPGDEQAARVFERMKLAYDILLDPEERRAHDATLKVSNSSQLAAGPSCATIAGGHIQIDPLLQAAGSPAPQPPLKQPPSEDLGAAPPSARPFAYVDREPGSATPASKAGLRRGDALLRIGEASHLRDVQAQLQASLNKPLPTLVVDSQGRFVKKWLVPHVWDAWAPKSLLGCQMSDRCPVDLLATHPAAAGEQQRMRPRSGMPSPLDELEDTYDDSGTDPESADVLPPPGMPRPRLKRIMASARRNDSGKEGAYWARCLLCLISLSGLGLGLTILLYPAFSYSIFDIWQLASLQCDAVIETEHIIAMPPAAPPQLAEILISGRRTLGKRASDGADATSSPADAAAPFTHAAVAAEADADGVSATPTAAAASARVAISNPSRVATAPVATATAPPPPHPPRRDVEPPPRPAPPPSWPLAGVVAFAPPCPPPPQPQRPPTPPPPMYASPDAGSILSRANENWITVIKATSLGLDVLRDSVRYILVASAVVVAISLIGLVLAMCPPSRSRALLAACYLGFGLPSWIFLSFVSVSALALRDDSERLITLYWKCLQRYAHELGGTGAGPPEPYHHVDAAASICIAAAALLLVGLLTVCRVIGWRTLARHSIIWIAGISGLVGAATLGVGIMLKLTSNVAGT